MPDIKLLTDGLGSQSRAAAAVACSLALVAVQICCRRMGWFPTILRPFLDQPTLEQQLERKIQDHNHAIKQKRESLRPK